MPICDLHQCTVSEALDKFYVFFEEHKRKGTPRICVMHGKGLHSGEIGKIRQKIQEIASRFYQERKIRDFSYGNPQEGGHGVTIIWMN